jgi:RNA polymerase sigma factor (sigma-70 family)
MNDYRVKITIRNERLLAAMEGMGYKSVAEFSRSQGLNGVKVREIFNGKIPPLDREGNPKELTKEILEILNLTIEKAFTEKQLKGFKKHTFEVKIEEEKLLQIISPAKNQEIKVIEQEVKSKLSEILSTLTPREERIVRMRFGVGMNTDHTLEEVGLQFSVTRDRIRQIEDKALRKLKHPTVARKLMEVGAQDAFTRVNFKKLTAIENETK